MLLEITKERTQWQSEPFSEQEDGKDMSVPPQISTFENLLLKAACAYPDLIVLAMEIRRRM